GPRGNILRFFSEPVGTMLRLHREYGKLAALSDRNPGLVCAFGAEFNQLLLSDANRFQSNEDLLFPVPKDSPAETLLVSLPMLNGPAHRRRRRLMMPSFARTAIEGYRDDIASIAERYVSRWTPGRRFDVAAEMHELTLEIALKCFFGLENTAHPDNLGRLGSEFLEGLISVWCMLLPFDLPGTPYRRFLDAAKALDVRVRRLITEKRARLDGQRDAFALLLGAKDEDGTALGDTELLGEAAILFIAGHETTSYTLSWTLWLLSQHPQVMADLVDELSSKLKGDAPTLTQLAELPLLDAVVKESMRLIPVTPMLFMRFAQEGFSLGGVEMPKGTGVVLSPLITHREPDVFPAPDRFRPERWATARPATYQYIPFGAGPRMCIGATFASTALRVVLPIILQRFRLELEPNARVSRVMRGLTMGPKHGLPMTAQVQDRRFGPPVPFQGDMHDLVRLDGEPPRDRF
ncbi:MAG TPA: cytochrome P450, partial [Myxococcaceae bacterium]|nr:cytochrome P450 [Myxococcaceae bacterium]